jgi:diguanylate cyclase (GGDEF)-like protein/PAS domain S-box-containing protein
MTNSPRPQSVALIALAIGVAATVAGWYVVGRQSEAEARAEFASQASVATHVIERRIQRYVDLLYGLDALANQHPNLSRLEFHHYVTALDLGQRLPGVQAVELLRRLRESGREAFVAGVRADNSLTVTGYPEFAVRPPGVRDEYWVVDFVEPMAGNEAAFGLDIRMRRGAKEAAERSRDTGSPIFTGKYRLAQETGTSYGLVMYLPVYSIARPASTEQRRQHLLGFVNVVLRADDMMAGMMAEPIAAGLRIRLHDRGAVSATEPVSESTLFYSTPGTSRADKDLTLAEWRPRHDHDLTVGGRQWLIEFEGAPAPSPFLRPLPLLVLSAGLVIALMLYGILRGIARGRSEAIALARRATDDLRRQLSFTNQMIEAMPNPIFYKDAEGRYLGCNAAFEDYVGHPRSKIVGKTVFEIATRETADKSASADRALLESPGSQSYESNVTHARDGSSREVIFNKATFYDPSGAVGGIVGVLVDITERKKLEALTAENAERLRAVIHASPLAIIARDVNKVITMWNPAAERMFGWSEAEVLNTATSIVPEHLKAETEAMRLRTMAGESMIIEETQRQARDGRLIDVNMTIAPIHDAHGVANGTMVTISDISRRKEAEAALRESEAHLRLAMEAAQMGMWYWECETDRFHYSDGLAQLFGRTVDSATVDYRVLQQVLHPDDRDLFAATVRHAVRQGTDFQVDYRVVWPDGSVHWLANRAQVHRDQRTGRAIRIVGVAMDLTDRKIAEQRIAHMAHHDALTGLPNRVLLRDRIQQAIAHAHRNQSQLAVLFIDLDRFKTINDSLGHQLGDRLLQSVASRILACVREGDTVSRVGGDEFVIVIPEIESTGDASAVSGKILEVLSNVFHLHGNDLHVAASIGISLYPSDGADAETLMRNADTAMYHAKDSGRANFQYFTQHMNVAAQQRLTLENALRRALEAREFELYYQPLHDLRDRSITGVEALIRWNRPGGEMVSPGEFIAVAEESGLIVPIGEWVLREALRQARAWQAEGRPLRMAVNVSANQLSRSSFVERLRRLIKETGVDPTLVELEVTEGVIVEGAGEAREAIDQIAALGVGIAIDDFGTGYSGLAYLKRLPIDTVKIDQSFVRDLTIDPDDAAIVTAIVAMARSLGVDVIAEGVETEEQVTELLRLGCYRAQGYLLSRPMPAHAIARLLRAGAMAPREKMGSG